MRHPPGNRSQIGPVAVVKRGSDIPTMQQDIKIGGTLWTRRVRAEKSLKVLPMSTTIFWTCCLQCQKQANLFFPSITYQQVRKLLSRILFPNSVREVAGQVDTGHGHPSTVPGITGPSKCLSERVQPFWACDSLENCLPCSSFDNCKKDLKKLDGQEMTFVHECSFEDGS